MTWHAGMVRSSKTVSAYRKGHLKPTPAMTHQTMRTRIPTTRARLHPRMATRTVTTPGMTRVLPSMETVTA